VLTVTRKQQLVESFRAAGLRGLTGSEMARLVGAFWRLRLRELRDDGYVFLEHDSRIRPGRIFRWVLVTEPAPDAIGDDALFVPAPPPPGDAIYGESS